MLVTIRTEGDFEVEVNGLQGMELLRDGQGLRCVIIGPHHSKPHARGLGRLITGERWPRVRRTVVKMKRRLDGAE